MRAKELVATLQACITDHIPVLIKGAPGVGKSDIVTQAAAAVDADLMIVHPVVEDPTDAKGLPAIVDGHAVFLPYGNLERMMTAKRLLVVFIDDLGQAPPVVQAAYMQLLLARQINGKPISKHVAFIAATNRREDRAGVTSILEPVKSRFCSIVQLDAHVDDWCEWALDACLPPELIAFIRFRPDLLMDNQPPTNDIVNRPCPRTVANVGRLLKVGLSGLEVLAGAVGSGFATEFVGFLKVWQSMPSIEGILANPQRAEVPNKPAALYAVTMGLVSRAERKTYEAIVKYASRMPEEFAVLLMKSLKTKSPEAVRCRAFVEWVAEHQDVLA